MKKSITLVLVLAAICLSCENKASKKVKETKEAISNTSKAYKELGSMQEDIEELAGMEPLTNEELKAWLPDEINGMKRTGYNAGQGAYMKIATIQGTYSAAEGKKKFEITLVDGAGQVGAQATMGMRMLFSQDFEEEDDYKSRKSVTHNGMKAVEEYQKKSNRSTIQVMYNERFYLNATGTNMSLEQTWEAIEQLDVDDLG